jgi:hypothetical protein
MQTKEKKERLSNILWGQARFITCREHNGKRASLYLMNKEYYIIWYSANDFERVEKIEMVTFTKATEIFGKIF